MRRGAKVIAAGLLIVAGLVLVMAPLILNAPNPPGTALGVATVVVGMVLAVSRLRTLPAIWSAVGFAGSVLWALLALGGFGQGTVWWDDVIEASVLAVLFGGALFLLVFAQTPERPS
jgi:hypothetical protein